MEVKFLGAARTVTGSKHLITTESGKKILLDCGLFQGKGTESDALNRHLGFNPSSVDYLILSHAHIDHSGNIPYLVKQGFSGIIYSTPQTFELCELMLMDSAKIHESDVLYINKKRARKGQELLKPLYSTEDVKKSLNFFVGVPYEEEFVIDENISLFFTNNGHILGSATTVLSINEGGEIKKICYTGDIGRPGDQILRHPQPFPQADYIITESTYGNRLHEKGEDAEKRLAEIVNSTISKKGKVIIPAFSLGRTQEIVYSLDRMYNQGILPKIKVFVDSPLSTRTTEIIRKHPECFNLEVIEYMMNDADPFSFNNLSYITSPDDSIALNSITEPCIIISSSGMAEAGRIKHHIKNNISNPRNTILMVGYCTPDSLGGQLLAGKNVVRIFGQEFEVKANIESIQAYSAHGDFKEMIEFLSCQDKQKVKGLFLVHGEYEVQKVYKEILAVAGFINIEIPEQNGTYKI